MVSESEEDGDVGKLTLQNLRKYDVRSVLHNFSRAWYDILKSKLANGWNRFLHDTDIVVHFGGFEATEFHRRFLKAKKILPRKMSKIVWSVMVETQDNKYWLKVALQKSYTLMMTAVMMMMMKTAMAL